MNNVLKKQSSNVKVGWALARVSTTHQAEVQHGSLEQQKNMNKRWAEDISQKSDFTYKIVRFIEEDVSGARDYTKSRVVLRELENAIEKRTIDFFVVEKIDRLTRDQVYNIQLARKAQEFGVEMHEYESGLVDLRDRGRRMSFNIKNMFGEDYVEDLKEKVAKKGREARVNNGKDTTSAPILGLDKHPSRICVFVINKEEQKIVIDIFKKFVELGSLKALEHYCRGMGYKTKERMTQQQVSKDGIIIPPRKIGGKPFDTKSLRYLLSCKKIRGIGAFKDTWNQFPSLRDEETTVPWDYAHFREEGPVVPLELFDQVQEILSRKSHKRTKTKTGGEVYLLSGILQKSNGVFLVGASAKGGSNHYYEDRKENEFRIPKEDIEKVVCDRIANYLRESGLIESILKNAVNDKGQELVTISNEIKVLKGKIQNLRTALDRFSDFIRAAALESASRLDEVCKTIQDERKKTEDELFTLEAQLINLENRKRLFAEEFEEKTIQKYLKAVFSDFNKKCSLQKKQLIQAIIPKIVVHPDNRLEIVLNPFFRGGGGPDSGSGGKKFGCEKIGWGGRDRTCECRNQNPMPYHLATPQSMTGKLSPVRYQERLGNQGKTNRYGGGHAINLLSRLRGPKNEPRLIQSALEFENYLHLRAIRS